MMRSVAQRYRSLSTKDRRILGLLAIYLVVAYTAELWLLAFGGEQLVGRARSGDPIALMLALYGLADRGFYDRPTPFIIGLESINVFFTQAVNLWLAYAILKDRPYRHAIQLAVGSYLAYSVVLYFWVHHLSGYQDMVAPSPLVFALLVLPNLPWLLGGLYLALDSAVAVTRRFSEPGAEPDRQDRPADSRPEVVTAP